MFVGANHVTNSWALPLTATTDLGTLDTAPASDVAVTVAEPPTVFDLVVVIVAVELVPGATPVTVTKPVPLMATVPDAVAVPAHAWAESKFVICTVKPVAVDVVAPNIGVNAAASDDGVAGAEFADARLLPAAFLANTLNT